MPSERREWRYRVYTSAPPSKARPIESRRLTYSTVRYLGQRLADQGHRVHLVDPTGDESGQIPKGAGVNDPIPPSPQRTLFPME